MKLKIPLNVTLFYHLMKRNLREKVVLLTGYHVSGRIIKQKDRFRSTFFQKTRGPNEKMIFNVINLFFSPRITLFQGCTCYAIPFAYQ